MNKVQKHFDSERFFSRKAMVFFFALICTLLWGSAFPCIKRGYEVFHIQDGEMGSQMLFAGVRFLIAGVATILISLGTEKKEYKKQVFGKWPLSGIFLVAFVQTFLQYVFYYVGMAHVTGVKGAILNGSMAFFCVVIACIFYKGKERLTHDKLVGCLLGMAGVVIVNLGKGELGSSFSLLGEGFMLLSAIVAALGSLANKEVSRHMGPITLCGWQLTVGSFMLIVFGIVTGGKLSIEEAGTSGVILLLYLAFISCVAFGLWTVLLKYNPMGRVTIYNFLIPVFGTIMSTLFLGDEIGNRYTLLALPLVCGGIYLVNRVKKNFSE